MLRVIQCDTRQKMNQKHHKAKEQYFVDHGYELLRSKMAIGDYGNPADMSVVVDTKQSCSELYSNLIQDHERFRNECILAQKCGVKLVVLVENNDGFTKPDDILRWKNPQMFRYWKAKRQGSKQKPPASNVTLLKIMSSMHRDYGVDFVFTSTEDAGSKIIEILGGNNETRTAE